MPRRRKEYYARINPMIKYTEEKFRSRYRLSKETVRQLAQGFARSPFAPGLGTSAGGGIGHQARFCLALRYFATGSFYSVIGDTQGVTKTTVCRAIRAVSNYLYFIARHHIKLPTVQQYAQRAGEFLDLANMPMTLGCVDGTHISLKRPTYEEAAYVNRKGYHSLNVQVTCDANNKIINLDATKAGCQGDNFIFRTSSLGRVCEEGRFNQFFLLGDSGYQIKPYLLTPYGDPRTPAQKAFNVAHRKTRSIVERTIGVLKSRWRCLDDSGGAIQSLPMRTSRIITACAVLHNIAIDNRMPEEFDDDQDVDAARPLPARQNRRRDRQRRARVRAMELEPEQNIDAFPHEERGARRRDYIAEGHFREN